MTLRLHRLALTTVAVAGLTAFAILKFRPAPAVQTAVDPTPLHEGTLDTTMPPEEVFKRALWRRPTTADTILHAERREWTKHPVHGVSHWQWFLAVQPGPALKQWLLNQNPFSLHPDPNANPRDVAAPPAWFPTDYSTFEALSGSSRGNFTVLWNPNKNLLYATSSGTGFASGAADPSSNSAPTTPLPAPVSRGRLPLMPPTLAPIHQGS